MRLWLTTALFGLLVTLAEGAQATSHHVPNKVARRALTLPSDSLRLDDGPYWPLPSGMVETTFFPGPGSTTRLNFGLGIGFSDDFEMGAHLVKL